MYDKIVFEIDICPYHLGNKVNAQNNIEYLGETQWIIIWFGDFNWILVKL